MGWLAPLSDALVGTDTAPVIYYIEQYPAFYAHVQPFFEAVARGSFATVTSMSDAGCRGLRFNGLPGYPSTRERVACGGHMPSVFLHGGGDGTEARSATFGRFVQATNPSPSRPLALIVAEEAEVDRQTSVRDYRAIFEAAGTPADCLTALEVSPTEPLTTQRLNAVHPSGLFVCGGLTPYYHRALCSEASWIDYLNAHQIPYGGTSAGAAIAAQYAILGGWQARHNDQRRPMLFHGASEGLTDLAVQPGLGLMPFAVDVHASQSGTLLRLIHAVDLEMAPTGWAIDEDTLLEATDRRLYLHGHGHAYYVQRAPTGGTMVRIYAAPVEIPTAG